MTSRIALLSVALIAGIATACSSSSGGGAPPLPGAGHGNGPAAAPVAAASGDVDVCKLLDAAKASTASGLRYVSVTSSHNMCNYVGADQNDDFFVIVFPNSSGDTAWREQLGILQSDGGAAPKTLSGAGERAAGCGTEIAAQSGENIIDVHGMPETTSGYPRSIAVAKAVITALH